MAKVGYRIPTGLNQNYGDTVITIRTKDDVGLKPMPVKTLLLYLLSILGCFMVVSKTVVSYGTVVHKVLFVLLWALITFVMLSVDNTGRMQAQLIQPLLSYLPKHSRYVKTQKKSNPAPFYGIIGIKDVGKNGLVTFGDGSFGYIYSVVGSASTLLFDEDRNRILDRVDNFYRKIHIECELIFITTKSAQRVYRQKEAMKRRFDSTTDPELRELLLKQFDCLNNYVGKAFKSIHQYLVIKGDNFEMFERAKSIVRAEVEGSTRMIRRCVPLKQKAVENLLYQIYCGKER